MIAPLEKLIDWSAIQLMTLMMPAHEHNPRLEEAVQFLKGPDFVPADSRPAQLEVVTEGSVSQGIQLFVVNNKQRHYLLILASNTLFHNALVVR